MKKNILIYPLLFISLLSSCNNNEEEGYSKEELYSLMSKFYDGYHVKGTLKKESIFSEEYSINNTTESISIDRDYGYLVKNENKHKAIRIYSDNESNTYYKGDDGKVKGDFLNYKNEVISEDISLGLSSPYFDNKYIDPIEFISYLDLDSELNLDLKKASFIIEEYFNEDVTISSSNLTLKDENVSANFVIKDKTCAFESDDGFNEYTLKYTLSLDFDFIDIEFNELKPKENENTKLLDAFNSLGSNFTLVINSESLENTGAYFVTSNGIVEVSNYNSDSLTSGDYYYKKSGNKYIKYQYNPGIVTDFVKIGEVSLDDILFNLDEISASIFESIDENRYALVDEAKTYVPYYLCPYNYRLNEDDGVSASIKLDSNSLISSIDTSFYYGGEYITYNMNIIDRGKSSYPSYFNENSSDFI